MPLKKITPYVFILLAILSLLPFVNAALALVAGILFALILGNPFEAYTRAYTSRLLAYSVIGLGAGMNLHVVLKAGMEGIGYTIISLVGCVVLGLFLGRILKAEREVSLLVTIGTAICGGSAIAAVAAAINAKSHNISASLAVVFFLNALALMIFPPIGHYWGLSQEQFGLWAALAIHDTSSVVGAGMQYGPQALEIATTIKLARALWIIPVVIIIQYYYSRAAQETDVQGKAKRKYPWFILGFLAMAALMTYVPAFTPAGHVIEFAARRALVLTLFLVGANLSVQTLRSVGFKPMILGVLLWVCVVIFSLLFCMNN